MGGNWGGGGGSGLVDTLSSIGAQANANTQSRMADARAMQQYGETLAQKSASGKILKDPPPRMAMGGNSAVLDSMNKSEAWKKFEFELPDNSGGEAFSGSFNGVLPNTSSPGRSLLERYMLTNKPLTMPNSFAWGSPYRT